MNGVNTDKVRCSAAANKNLLKALVMKIHILRQSWAGIACVAVSVTLASQTSANDSIRIEPTPVYGATVEMQEGVRIVRFLPSSRQIIVNSKVTAPVTIKVEQNCKKASCSK